MSGLALDEEKCEEGDEGEESHLSTAECDYWIKMAA